LTSKGVTSTAVLPSVVKSDRLRERKNFIYEATAP
jgi:hypothetical protein